MNTFLFFKRLLFVWVFAISASFWAQNTYTLITQESELTAGAKYLIANGTANGSVILLGPQATNNRTGIEAFITAGSITTTAAITSADLAPFEITLGGSSNLWILNDFVNGTKLGPSKGNNTSNHLKPSSGIPTYNITFSGNAAIMTCVGSESNSNGRNIVRLNLNGGSPLFSNYASGQQPIYIFKKETFPTIALSNNGTQITAGNVMQGTANQILSTFKVDVTNANATMTEATFITDGDYTSADISDFKLWYNSTNSFSGASIIGTESSSSSGTGDFLDFSGFSTTINFGSAGYYWITTSITNGATIGKTINLDAILDADLIFTTGNKSGSASTAGLQTIVATTTVTWVGTSPAGSWTNGTPSSSVDVIIDGDYNENASFSAKTLTVNANKTLIVNSYRFVKAGDVYNYGDILVAHNANFVQTGSYNQGPTTTFRVSRATKDVQRFDYISWSSPLKNSLQTLKEFSYGIVNPSAEGTLNSRFYTYNGGSFVNTTSLHSEPFVTGQGYQIRTPNDFTTTAPGTTFHGFFEGVEPNTGIVNYDASGISGNYVFLGNPYPSAIGMASFLTVNNAGLSGISGTIYIWNSAAKMVGTAYTGPDNYISHNASGSNPPGSLFYVPVAQGFFVDRQGNTVNNFVFNDAMRSTTETGTFAKVAVVDRFWLKMDSNAGSPHMLFAFSADATTGLDHEYDGKLIENNPDTSYTKVSGQKMVIDTHGSFQANDSFDVYINSTVVKNYTISIAQKDGLFNTGQSIYLRDKTNGSITDLTNGNYTFTSAGTGEENRFEVFFINSVLATSNAVKEELTIYGNEGVLYVESPSEMVNVKVYDLSGRLILNKKVQGKTMQTAINDVKFVLVSVQLKDGSTVSKKIKL